ncbi:hypothetical protein SELMODRAFT_404540 [Selaginella moellendorffii]|uniref:Uncharacterized protein n=1 Tax=Selaginella moellendorffii TaxID=88036 RepID=D8QVN4_SELML|nr:hypothetical protein SELMODRAFT_404538 [Selaginella moellendorffii]EFJ36091.1 hypothetical protein SELMODRAFT_404540 [Selaginella moellendorffii]
MYIRQHINPTTNKILNARVVLVRILQNEVEQKERKRMNQERKKSRDFIADSIETVMGGQWNSHCNGKAESTKHYGTIKPGVLNGHAYDIVSAFQLKVKLKMMLSASGLM